MQEDGGDLQYISFESGVVLVKMKGSCAGCPSSAVTLKSGIENMLKHYVPEVVEVQATEDWFRYLNLIKPQITYSSYASGHSYFNKNINTAVWLQNKLRSYLAAQANLIVLNVVGL